MFRTIFNHSHNTVVNFDVVLLFTNVLLAKTIELIIDR